MEVVRNNYKSCLCNKQRFLLQLTDYTDSFGDLSHHVYTVSALYALLRRHSKARKDLQYVTIPRA